jgi:hypothetical protein
MELILIIIVLLVLFGGGGFLGYSRGYYGPGPHGLIWLLVVAVIVILLVNSGGLHITR